MEKKIDIKECIRFGWTTFKVRPLYFAGVFLLLFAIQFLFDQLSDDKGILNGHNALLGVAALVSFIVSIIVDMCTRKFSLQAHDNPQSASVRTTWVPGVMWKYAGATILVVLGVICGLILLIIPGLIFAMALMFTLYLVLEKNLDPIAAMKESIRMTKGYRMQLFGLSAAAVLINILGLLALVVGLLVSIPVSMFAMAHAYRVISGTSAHTPTPEGDIIPAS